MRSKSPLPGMDPWLEAYWRDIHTRLTTYASDQLQPILPKELKARVEEYVSVESIFDEEEWRQNYVPDVAITQSGSHLSSAAQSVVTMAESTRMILPRLVEPPTLRRVQIIDTKQGNRLITSIEFLSPSNKLGQGRKLYLAKQREMLEGGVNIVEIDLVRTGNWTLSINQELVPAPRRGLYRASVVRGTRQEQSEYYPIPIKAPLPKIHIPLRPDDSDVVLDLQPLLDTAYVNGGYADDIDYSVPPDPPLPKNVAEWADEVISGLN